METNSCIYVVVLCSMNLYIVLFVMLLWWYFKQQKWFQKV